METRPARHPPQKLRQARAAYRKSGGQPRLSDREYRELQRGAELLERATKLQQAERRKKLNQQKRAEKEEQEREAKRRKLSEDYTRGKMFVGSTQFPRSQFRIEKFITGREGTKGKKVEEQKSEDSVDPWDEDDVDDGSLLELLDDCETFAKPISLPARSIEKRRLSLRTSDDFDFASGLSTQDFEAVDLEKPAENPAYCSAALKRTVELRNGVLMPPPAPPVSKQTPPLSIFGISSQDLDSIALAEFEPSQAIH